MSGQGFSDGHLHCGWCWISLQIWKKELLWADTTSSTSSSVCVCVFLLSTRCAPPPDQTPVCLWLLLCVWGWTDWEQLPPLPFAFIFPSPTSSPQFSPPPPPPRHSCRDILRAPPSSLGCRPTPAGLPPAADTRQQPKPREYFSFLILEISVTNDFILSFSDEPQMNYFLPKHI